MKKLFLLLTFLLGFSTASFAAHGGAAFGEGGSGAGGAGTIVQVGDCTGPECFADGSDLHTLIFEGSSVDGFETRVTAADPITQDGVLSFPNVDGTVAITDGTLNAGNYVKIDSSGRLIDSGNSTFGGDVVGPISSTDNALVRFDSTTGKLLQNSGTTLDDSGNMSIPGTLTVGDIVTSQSGLSILQEGLVINEEGGATATHLFRVEGDTDPNLIYVDAANNRVGIGTNAPASTLDVRTSLAIPVGTAPTVDNAGEIAVDTTDGQFIYYGSAKRVIPYTVDRCWTFKDPVDATDNVPVFFPSDAITVVNAWCQSDGTTPSIAATISDGTNAFEAITCDDDGATDDGSITNASFTARERMEIDFGAPSGTVTYASVCVTYTTDAQ